MKSVATLVLTALMATTSTIGASPAVGQYCGVAVSRIQSYVACEFQYADMDKPCTSIGGIVAGHNWESGDARSNCVVYCNNVPTDSHDVMGTIVANPAYPISRDTTYHLYVVDTCSSCDYCGPSR